jgi:excisionase family DNA binding protein
MKREKVPYYTQNEAAAALRVSRDTIERWIKEGKLKALKFGKTRQAHVRIPGSELETFIKKVTK